MAPYFEKYFTKAQKDKWLSGIVSGEIIPAIAMTEPDAGSDLIGTRIRMKLCEKLSVSLWVYKNNKIFCVSFKYWILVKASIQ